MKTKSLSKKTCIYKITVIDSYQIRLLEQDFLRFESTSNEMSHPFLQQ